MGNEHAWKDHDGWIFATNGTKKHDTIWAEAAEITGAEIRISHDPRGADGQSVVKYGMWCALYRREGEDLTAFWVEVDRLEGKHLGWLDGA